MNDSSGKLRILLLSDDLPGHRSQSRGLVKWLENRYSVVCYESSVRLKCKLLARLILPHLVRSPFLAFVVVQFYRGVPSGSQDFDLIISAGGSTSFLNVALAQQWHIPNVFMGSKRRLHSEDFAAHLTLEETGEPHNIVMMLAPTQIDPTELQQKGKELRLEQGLAADERFNMLAVGGDGAGYQYDRTSVQNIAELMKQEYRKTDKRWLLTTSRRTGPVLEQQLKETVPAELLADAVWWSEAPRKVMVAYMGAADCLFITADSMSMIAEAIFSTRPVVVLRPGKANPETRYADALDRYEKEGLCRLATLGQPICPPPEGSCAVVRAREALLDELSDQLGLNAFRHRC